MQSVHWTVSSFKKLHGEEEGEGECRGEVHHGGDEDVARDRDSQRNGQWEEGEDCEVE